MEGGYDYDTGVYSCVCSVFCLLNLLDLRREEKSENLFFIIIIETA